MTSAEDGATAPRNTGEDKLRLKSREEEEELPVNPALFLGLSGTFLLIGFGIGGWLGYRRTAKELNDLEEEDDRNAYAPINTEAIENAQIHNPAQVEKNHTRFLWPWEKIANVEGSNSQGASLQKMDKNSMYADKSENDNFFAEMERQYKDSNRNTEDGDHNVDASVSAASAVSTVSSSGIINPTSSTLSGPAAVVLPTTSAQILSKYPTQQIQVVTKRVKRRDAIPANFVLRIGQALAGVTLAWGLVAYAGVWGVKKYLGVNDVKEFRTWARSKVGRYDEDALMTETNEEEEKIMEVINATRAYILGRETDEELKEKGDAL